MSIGPWSTDLYSNPGRRLFYPRAFHPVAGRSAGGPPWGREPTGLPAGSSAPRRLGAPASIPGGPAGQSPVPPPASRCPRSTRHGVGPGLWAAGEPPAAPGPGDSLSMRSRTVSKWREQYLRRSNEQGDPGAWPPSRVAPRPARHPPPAPLWAGRRGEPSCRDNPGRRGRARPGFGPRRPGA